MEGGCLMRLEVNGFDEVMKKLNRLSDKSKVDEIAKKAVNAALPKLESSVRSHVQPRAVAGNVVTKKAETNEYGVFGVATIEGHVNRGGHVEPAAKVANVVEYGRGHRIGRHPWRAASASSAESACIETATRIVEAEMELEQ